MQMLSHSVEYVALYFPNDCFFVYHLTCQKYLVCVSNYCSGIRFIFNEELFCACVQTGKT